MTLIRNKQIIIDSDWSLNNMHLTNAPDPILDHHVANKAYVDSVAAGLDPKESVRFATTGNISGFTANTFPIGGTAWTYDGVTAANDDRVLVKDQTDPTQNGIYTVSGVGTDVVLTRSSDFDGTPSHEVSAGNYTFVETGSFGGTGWVVLGDGVLTVNTDPIVWSQFSESTSFTAGEAISLSSGTIDVLYDNTLTLNGNQLSVNTSALGLTSTDIGDFATAVNNEVFQAGNFVDGLTIDFTVAPGDTVTAEVINGSIGTSKLNITGGTQGTDKILAAVDASGDDLKWVDVNTLVTLPDPYSAGDAINIDTNNEISVLYDDDTIKLDSSGLYVDKSALNLEASDISDLVSTINSTVFDSNKFVDSDTIDFTVDVGTVTAEVMDNSIGASKFDASGTKLPDRVLVATGDPDGLRWSPVGALVTPDEFEISISNTDITPVSSGSGIIASVVLGSTEYIKPNSYPELYVNGVKYKLGENTGADAWLGNSYATDPTEPVMFGDAGIGTVIVWSADNSGVPIDEDDEIIFKYTNQVMHTP